MWINAEVVEKMMAVVMGGVVLLRGSNQYGVVGVVWCW